MLQHIRELCNTFRNTFSLMRENVLWLCGVGQGDSLTVCLDMYEARGVGAEPPRRRSSRRATCRTLRYGGDLSEVEVEVQPLPLFR